MSAMERLLDFAERTRLIETEDRAYARNRLLEAMRLDAPEHFEKITAAVVPVAWTSAVAMVDANAPPRMDPIA